MSNGLDAIRERNLERGLAEQDLIADPIEQYQRWLAEADDAGVHQPDAAVLATAGADAQPTARHVLIRGWAVDELWFYTNRESDKGKQMAENPQAALLAGWIVIGRQARFEGPVELLDDEASDGYWATRPRGSQIAARASSQTRRSDGRADLLARRDTEEQRWKGGDVPRPNHWGGYRLRIERAEFWQGRPDRLHDRFRYEQTDGTWQMQRLDP